MYDVTLYWRDDDGTKHLLGRNQYDAKSIKEARSRALDDMWPRHLDAPASYKIDVLGENVGRDVEKICCAINGAVPASLSEFPDAKDRIRSVLKRSMNGVEPGTEKASVRAVANRLKEYATNVIRRLHDLDTLQHQNGTQK
jgi:uncharacterized protein (UPF0210 family)